MTVLTIGIEGVLFYRRRQTESDILGKAPPTRQSSRQSSATAAKPDRGLAMSGGIYQIENQVNGKRYVGSAVNLAKRWHVHLGDLRRGQHRNQHLQRAFDKYGESTFEFSVLEHIKDTAQLIPREQYYFDVLSPEYNIARIAGSTLGVSVSVETRKKLSEAKKDKPWSIERRRKMNEAWRLIRHRRALEKQHGKALQFL